MKRFNLIQALLLGVAIIGLSACSGVEFSGKDSGGSTKFQVGEGGNGNGPDTPDTPDVPPDTPDVPPDTPDVPPDTPDVPPDTPDVPPDTPDVPPDTPDKPGNDPDKPDKPEVPDTPDVPNDDVSNNDPKPDNEVYDTGCNVGVQGILLSLEGASVNKQADVALNIAGDTVDILNLQIPIIIENLEDRVVNNVTQVRLKIGDTGNAVIDADGNQKPLAVKVPGGELKLQITKTFLKASSDNDGIVIRCDIDPMKQLAGNKRKCVLKPVVHDCTATFVSDEF